MDADGRGKEAKGSGLLELKGEACLAGPGRERRIRGHLSSKAVPALPGLSPRSAKPQGFRSPGKAIPDFSGWGRRELEGGGLIL